MIWQDKTKHGEEETWRENPKTEEQLNNHDCNTDEMLSKQTINPCIGSAKLGSVNPRHAKEAT